MGNIDVNQVLENLAQLFQQMLPEERQQFLDGLAPYVSLMAFTGDGTNACLGQGCLPMPVHCYSPVPDMNDLKQRNIWDRKTALSGIDWNLDRQAQFLIELGREYGSECNWPPYLAEDGSGFYTENKSFCFGCAASTHSIIRHYKPRRVIEIGSGFSSQVINAALALNAGDLTAPVECAYMIIDPYPNPKIAGPSKLTSLIEQRVELMDIDFFRQLQANDILFIDSGHTVRIGGDVNYLILDVLPILAPGVVIHFHDIPFPYEYGEVYYTNPSFRVFWTEGYLLQAFLSCNREFEILLAMCNLMLDRPDAFRTAFPYYNPEQHGSISGSFWLRRK